MKNRVLSFLLVVLTVFAALILPTAASSDPGTTDPPATVVNYETATKAALQNKYATVKEKLTAEITAGYTELYAQTDKYQLFCNKYTGEVYLRDRTTGQYLTTNPTDVKPGSRAEADRLSQVWMSFKTFESDAVEKKYTSFAMAAQKGQISVSRIKGGLRVEYTLGDVTSRYVAPQAILDTDFQETLLRPYEESILNKLNYEFITQGFSTFVDTDDPEAVAVYQRLDELELNDDLDVFKKQVDDILGTYSASATQKYKNVCSIFYHNYKDKKKEVTDKIAKGTVQEKAEAQELKQQMLEQIRSLIPDANDLPGETAVGVALNNLYSNIGNFKAFYGNPVDLNKYMADPVRNSSIIENYQNQYRILQNDPGDEPYPLIRVLDYDKNDKPENLVSLFQKVERFIANSGIDYTLATMLEQEAKVDFDALVFDNPLFRCALEYTIDDTGMTVDIPASSIVFDESKYQLTELSFLRYLGAGEITQDGYMFYPDGSGALIYNQTMPSSAVLNQPIYSFDYSYSNLQLSNSTNTVNSSQPIRLPVFGAVNLVNTGDKDNPDYKNVGYLAIITEGESLARLIATHLDNDGAFVGTYASYTLRASDSYSLSRLQTGASVAAMADFKYTGFFTQKYVMLTDDPGGYRADYVGMADAYRDYLFGRGELSALDAAELKARLPLYIESYATVKTTDTVLSFPVTVNKPLTTFEDVKTIGDDLRGVGIGNVKFRLIGFYNDGFQGFYPNRVKWMKEVGGKKGFKSLVKYVEEHKDDGFETFTDVDLLYNYRAGKAGGISRKKTSARSMDDRYVRKVMYSTIYRTTTKNAALLVSASKLTDLFNKFDKKFSKFKATSISLANLAADLSSNFNEDDFFTREGAKTLIAGTLETVSGKYSVMATGGNVYTIPYVDYLLSAPVDGSHYNSVSRTVPFFGMVMHGALQYAGEVFNEAGNPDYELLRDIESGAAMYVVLVYQNTDLMKEDYELIKHYAANYEYWRDDLISYYNILDYAIGDLQSYRISDHQFLSGERKILDWEIAEDAKILEEEYISILERQYEQEITLRNRLISQLWFLSLGIPLNDDQRRERIEENATKMLNGGYGDALKEKLIAVVDPIVLLNEIDVDADSWESLSDAKKNSKRLLHVATALTKLIDPLDPAYDEAVFTVADPDEGRKYDLAEAMLAGDYGADPKAKIESVIAEITPGYPDGTDPNAIKNAAVEKLMNPADPLGYGIVIGATQIQVAIDAEAIKADAKAALKVEQLSEWLEGKIDEFAATKVNAAGIMPFTISGVTDYENETAYSFVTASAADDPDYKKTSYTVGDGSIVLVTYSNGAETVRFLLNFSIFTVNVKYGGQTYTLGKYDFIRLDPRADEKTDPRKQ